MHQRWSDIVWCHWPVSAEQVAAVLPPGLTPHLFEDMAWVGLIPFSMSALRLPGPLRPISKFLGVGGFGEVNVRTYVTGPDGRTGVWFCTLDADRRLAVATARTIFQLPYRVADTRCQRGPDSLAWTSRRKRDGCRAELTVLPSPLPSRPAAPGLEQFLVERYSLYSWWYGRLMRGTLVHQPWNVRPATLTDLRSDTVASAGFSVPGSPHVLVGDPVDVSVYRLRGAAKH